MKAGRTRLYCNNCEEEESENDEQESEGQEIEKILKDIQNKVNAIPSLKKQLNAITASMALLSEKYDSLLAQQEEDKKKINSLDKSFISINNKCVYLEKCNMALEQKMLEFEQASRKLNIEIVGLEQLPNENINEVVKKLADTLEVSSENIEWASRRHQRKQSNRPAPIIVGFKNTGGAAARNSWLAKRSKLIELNSSMITGGSQKHKIYINEDLTKTTRMLLWNTKIQLKAIYKYIWVVNGKILVKKAEGDKSVCIRSEEDIRELTKKDNIV